MRPFLSIIKDDQAATAVEYGLILALIFLAMIGGVTTFGNAAVNMWETVANNVTTA